MNPTENHLNLKGFQQKEVRLFAIQNQPDVILIEATGYGSYDGMGVPGEGCNDIVMVEHYGGRLRVIVWGDINQEDATHIIDLEGARESNRRTYD